MDTAQGTQTPVEEVVVEEGVETPTEEVQEDAQEDARTNTSSILEVPTVVKDGEENEDVVE
jgi:hypothetical protein